MLDAQSDIGAIFARLREEVRRGGDGRHADPVRLPSRAEAERLWSVTAEPRIERRRGPRGFLVYRVKRVLHRLMGWYIEPFAAMQREFNLAALRLVDELGEHAGDELGEHARVVSPDYFAFESRMRGSTASVRERQAVYVEDFRDAAPVLDVGCGRGEFLKLLAETGIEARGIDVDADMVAYCRREGLDVDQTDALAYLASVPDGELGGIFCAHVVEHLELPTLVRLLELAAAKLRPEGLFIAETPNPLTLVALSTFFADLTHVRPLHPETLSLLARQLGFAATEIRYLNEPEAGARLSRMPAPDGEGAQALHEALDENFERLNQVVFGPQDFALVAHT